MTKFVVFHIDYSEEVRADINANGRECRPEGWLKVDLTMPISKDADLPALYVQALELNMVAPAGFVDVPSLSQVFETTNHITHNWTTNPEVIWADKHARSTSAGDLVMNIETGDIFRCSSFGWESLYHPKLEKELTSFATDVVMKAA